MICHYDIILALRVHKLWSGKPDSLLIHSEGYYMSFAIKTIYTTNECTEKIKNSLQLGNLEHVQIFSKLVWNK